MSHPLWVSDAQRAQALDDALVQVVLHGGQIVWRSPFQAVVDYPQHRSGGVHVMWALLLFPGMLGLFIPFVRLLALPWVLPIGLCWVVYAAGGSARRQVFGVDAYGTVWPGASPVRFCGGGQVRIGRDSGLKRHVGGTRPRQRLELIASSQVRGVRLCHSCLFSYHLVMAPGGLDTVVSPAFTAEDSARYHAAGWWSDSTLSDAVRRNAVQSPDRAAYVDHPDLSLNWREFDDAATALAEQLAGVGVAPGDRVAVWHGDSAAIHALYVAVERCGAVVVGIGARAGTREVAAILRSSQPRILISDPQHGNAARQGAAGLPAEFAGPVLVLGRDAGALSLNIHADPAPLSAESRLGADDVFLINSTSGTTGMPKCVMHTQNRWRYFHQKAVANGVLTSEDVFLPVIPTPFGFGIWTTHTTPIYLGATAVILERFTPTAACEAIARHKVTVLCCVSTQLTMLMADRTCRDYDLSSVRVVFTGGEALPFRPAAEFEELTGAKILQFYGSNETGLLSGTSVNDSRESRLRTAGKIVPEMSVRLFDGDEDVTETGRGQPACRGPATCVGYLGGTDHDKLFTSDGWMRMGDICQIDPEGYLRVTGRISDFIVRGGKNISAAQVEDAVTTHPAVAVAAAVAMPDPVFGEKVCVYAELSDSHEIDLSELIEHLLAQGISKELLPEQLIVFDELPRSSGGKIAKGQLREEIRARMGADHERS